MLTPLYSRQYQRDLKLMLKRGKDPEKLKLVMTTLLNEEPLPAMRPKSAPTLPQWVEGNTPRPVRSDRR